MNSENMSNHSSTKKFWASSVQTTACGHGDFFFGLHLFWFWAEKWTSADVMKFTSADVMTLKVPVLLLRSENIVGYCNLMQ